MLQPLAQRGSLCGVGTTHLWQSTRFCNALFADLLFARERNADWGVGVHAEVSTAGFWDARYGGGPALLVPVASDFPLIVSLGAYGHELESVALGGSLFFGSRSYNFHSTYNLAAGLFVAAYRDLGDDPASLVAIGIELDAFLIAAPFVLLASELR